MNKLKNKKGFFPLWLGMQEAICGIKPKTNLNPDQQTNDDDQLPDLGLFIFFFLFSFIFFSQLN
jgi:hypothetical protein